MSEPARPIAQLLAGLPPIGPGVELIVRGEGDAATATLRRDGTPPRVFAATAAGVRERLPGDDEDLPGRALLADPAVLRAALEPHVGAVRDSRLVAWRPGRRAVVQVQLRDGGCVWLKLLDGRSWSRATNAFAAVQQALPPMQLCLPEHLLPGHCGHVSAAACGASLRTLLAEGEAPPWTTIARALLALSYTPVRGELPVLDFAAARTAAVAMLAKGAVLRPDLSDLAAALAVVPAPPPQTGFVHGDLHDKQLFVHHAGTSLIDLEGIAVGDPRFDLANLAEHVRLRDQQQSRRDSGLADVLLARCGLHPDAPATRAFRAVVRARLCGVYAARPRWPQLVDQLRTGTLDLMDGLS